MSENEAEKSDVVVTWARRAGQIAMGLTVGALMVIAVLEVQSGKADSGFVYEGF